MAQNVIYITIIINAHTVYYNNNYNLETINNTLLYVMFLDKLGDIMYDWSNNTLCVIHLLIKKGKLSFVLIKFS